ncbi:hypothetical protein C0J52_13483 [Blattella germanica]|nr:hypothetical protein C0J52_13483 [Blattella germanica]
MLDKEKKNDNEPPDAHLYENMMEKIDKSINFMMDERIHSSPVFKGIQDDGDTNLSIEIPVDQKPILEVHQPKGRNSRWKWKTGEREKIKLSALMMAASQGFEDEVKRLLQQDDANPNGEPNKWGPLHISAYKGHVDVVRYLLEFPGTDITCKDSKGRTALHLATLKGKYEVLKLLLGVSRIDICAVDNDGFTALHTACASPFIGEIPPGKFIQCIYLLMSREGMNLNVPDKEGITALGRALMASDKDLALAMLEHEKGHLLNVDAFIPRHYRKTVRDVLPSIYPDLDIKLPNPLQEDEHSPKPSIRLLASLQKGDFNTFQALLLTQSFVSDISEHFYYEPYHCTILEIACQIRHRKEFIKALLTAGADPNTKNKITNLPVLHLVVKIGNLDALKILLKAKNTDINIRDDNGLTPLHCLASIRIPCSNETDSEILQHSINLLLEESNLIHNKADDLRQKIDLNAVANNGETPLHLAARMGEKDILLTLLRNGADVIHKTVGGELEITDIPFDKVPYVSQIILTVFVFLMAVVLINLLNGLAVSDAQTIMNDAEVWSHSARVTLICYLKEMNYDRVGFFSTLKSIPGKKLKIFPNRKCGEVEIHGKVYQNRKIDPDTIQDAILLVTKTRESKCKSNAMKNSGQCEFRRKIADLERNQEIINKKLNELSEQLNFHKDSKNIY